MFNIEELQSPLRGTKAFRVGRCTILVGVEMGLWHLISHEERYPDWNEIKWARYQEAPGM